MKKESLEMVIDALNDLENGSTKEEFMLKKSDVKYLKSHLTNYTIESNNVGGSYILKISKKEPK